MGFKDKEGDNGICSGEQQEGVVMCAKWLGENPHLSLRLSTRWHCACT